MNFEAHRARIFRHCLQMVEAGPGWHPYVLRYAEQLDRQEMYAGMLAAVLEAMGPQAEQAARKAAKWMEAR